MPATSPLKKSEWQHSHREALQAALNGEPLEESLGALARAAVLQVGEGARAAFYLADAEGATLHHVVGMGSEYAACMDGFSIGPESMACGLAAHTGEPVITADVRDDLRWKPRLALADRFDYRGCWSFPISTSAQRFVGTLAIYSREPRAATQREIDLVSVLTETAAIIVSRHHEAEARREAEAKLEAELADQKLLQSVSAEISHSEDSQGLYDKITEAAVTVMRSDFASMQMLYPERGERGELRLLASSGYDLAAAKFWEWVRADSGCTCGMAMKTGRRAVASDVRTCEFMAGTPDRENSLRMGMLSMQSTPLISRRGKLVGMISTHWKRPHTPSERDVRLLDILARQAADLLERQQNEDALRAAHTRLQKVMEVETVGVMFWDLATGRMTDANDSFLEMMGYSRAEVAAGELTWQRLTPPEYVEMSLAELRRFQETGRVGPYEKEYLRKDGARQWFVFAGSALNAGTCVEFCVDIGERKRAEKAVRASEEKYRTLFDSIDDGFCIIEVIVDGERPVDYRFLEANPSFVAHTGLTNAIGRTVRELVPGHEAHWVEIYARIARTGTPERFTNEAKALGRWYDVYAFRVGEAHERKIAVLFSDITERVRMTEQIARQSEQIADESRRKDEFLAMLSHELRNPLAPIRSAVHLLRMQERPGAEDIIKSQAHEIIERQVGNLTKLVSDLLEVSRVVSGRVRLNQQPLDLNQVAGHAIETSAPLFEQRKHTLVRHACPNAVWCNADATRLEEVLVNLLNNAAKYTPDGGQIEVWCERPDAGTAQFRIRDNGVGIEPDLLPRVFDLFTQADRSLARSAGGLGIGLSLAHRLVALHGGTIDVKSPPPGQDVGSEFVVRLACVPPPMAISASEPEARTERPDGLRVLMVDDNIDFVMMTSSSLRSKGFSVQAAYTGPDGLKVAHQWRPDVLLLDIGLPILDGYEVCRRLRVDPPGSDGGRRMRIIALTGYGRDADLARAREVGFDGHMTKPIEFGELEKLLAGASVRAK